MDARLQIRVQRYGWDAAANRYHTGWQRQLKPAHDTLLLMTGLSAGQKVIETACGSGLLTSRIVEVVGQHGHVTATDLSQGMIDDLMQRTGSAFSRNLTAARMPAEALAPPDGQFDAAVCALGLMYTPDPLKAVKEMARVVVPGGTVSATVWGERRNCGWADVFPIVDAHVASEVCPLFFATGAPNALTRIFEQAGLVQVEEHRQSEILHFEDEAAVLDAVLLGGPVALAVKRFDEDSWNVVCGEFMSSVAAYQTSEGRFQIPGEFVSVSGRTPTL